MLNPNLLVVSVFDRQFDGRGTIHPEYGREILLNIVVGDKVIKLVNDNAWLTSCFLQCLDLEEFRIETEGSKTYQYLRPTLTSCFLADIVYRMNRQFIDENCRLSYDPTKELVLSDQKMRQNGLVDRDIVHMVANPLLKEDVVFIGAIGGEQESWLKWQHCFGGIGERSE